MLTFTRTRATGALALYVDGTLAATATGTTNSLNTPNRLVLAAQQTLTNFLSGDLAEVKLFSSPLLDVDRQLAERTLANKYGISGNFGTNLPPTVLWNAPTNNSVFIQPLALLLTASADDADGTVARVEFFNGTNLLGTVTSAPYTLTWSNIPPGSYSLLARATDNLGTTKNSTPITILVQPLTLAVLPGSNTGTQFAFQFQGQNGHNYYVETSTNLAAWIRVLTNTPTNTVAVFTDTNAIDTQRFYRVSQ